MPPKGSKKRQGRHEIISLRLNAKESRILRKNRRPKESVSNCARRMMFAATELLSPTKDTKHD